MQQNNDNILEQSMFSKSISYITGGTAVLVYNYVFPYKSSGFQPTKLAIHIIKTFQYGVMTQQITNAVSDLLLQIQQTGETGSEEQSMAIDIHEQVDVFDIGEELIILHS